MSYYTLDSEKMAKEIIKVYTDRNGNVKDKLYNMAMQYVNGENLDFFYEVYERLDIDTFAENVANEVIDFGLENS